MSSNRLIYDNCAFKTQIQDSTTPLAYRLYLGNYKNCNSCPGKFSNDLDFGSRADVESELRNQGVRIQSKCPGLKYDPTNSSQGAPITPHHICQGIYHITPHGQQMPANPGFDASTLGRACCKKQ